MKKTSGKTDKFLDALNECGGLIGAACKSAGITYKTYRKWRAEDGDFDSRVQDVLERQTDMAECALLKNIQSGDTTAIIFYLKTKGKGRGYTERAQPQPDKAQPRTNLAAAAKRAREIEDTIRTSYKTAGLWDDKLEPQAKTAAFLSAMAEAINAEMTSPAFDLVQTEYSREGNARQAVNPKVQLGMQFAAMQQQALKSLDEAAHRRSDDPADDPLGKLIDAFRGDDT